MNYKPSMKRSAIAIALALIYPNLSFAQEMESVQKVVVTGSNIKRVDSETASPLQVISREEIIQSGANTVKEILDNLTSNDGNGISDLGGANSWASGATGISLRNLGMNATLTLLNGRRLSSYGFADGLQNNFVNIDSIPANVIERVEVLKDGASAIYGSDAVAGVINIITRKDFKGLTLNASAQSSTRDTLLNREEVASITGGVGDLAKDGYNAFAHLEVFRRDGYKDRDIYPQLPDWYLLMNPTRNNLSTGSFPGNYVGRYPANYPDPNLAGRSFMTAAPGCAPNLLKNGLCFYDYWKDSDAQPPAERITFLSSARKKISDNLSVYGELQLAQTKSTYHTAIPRSNVNGVPLTWYDSRTAQLQYFTDPKLPVGHPNNPYPFPVGLNYRFIDDPDLFKNVAEAHQFRALIGAEGNNFGWDWDSAIGTMGSTASQKQHFARDRVGYYNAIVSGEYKFGQINSPAVLNQMFPEYGSHGQSTQSFLDFKATREIMPLGGGPLQVATGFDLRHETFNQASSDNVLNAQIVQFSGVEISGARNLGAAFVEFDAPITKQLDANFALRADKSTGTENAVVPKFGLAYKVTPNFMLRGTAAEGFRAPSLPETGNGGASWFNNGIVDPKRCATAMQMSDILKTGNAVDVSNASVAYNLGCSASFPSAVTPNPNLRPEKSKSFTLGFVLQATKDTSITFDYYNIKRRDEISTQDINVELANEDTMPGLVQRGALTQQDIDFAQRVKALSGQDIHFLVGPIATIGAQYQNLSKTKVSGVDVDVDSKWNLGSYGKLDTGLQMTYQIDDRGWNSFANSYTENFVGRSGVPKITALARASWQYGNWTTGARVHYFSATTLSWGDLDTIGSPQGCADRKVPSNLCRIAADATVDMSLQYKGFKNATLAMNVFDLFNRDSPVVMVPNGSLPLRGRTVKLSFEYKFY